MGMDRNTIIGFVLIGILLIGMFVVNSKNRLSFEGEQKRIADSIAALAPVPDTAVIRQDSVKLEVIQQAKQENGFQQAVAQQDVTVENDVLKIVFTNKGAQPKEVILKKYNKYDGSGVVLQGSNFGKLAYDFNSGTNETTSSADVLFAAEPVVINPDGSQSITFKAGDSSGQVITHQYIIRPNNYMIDFNINVNGKGNLFSQNTLSLQWQTETQQLEKDHKYELTQTHVCYVEDGSYDFDHVGSAGNTDNVSFKKPVDWFAVKQQFFISAIAAKSKFTAASIDWKVPEDSSSHILQTTAVAKIALTSPSTVSVPLQLYYGPSDYNILKQYDNNMQNMVPYGSGPFAFVKYINRHFLLPVFEFIHRHVASMGMVILLLTLLIRLFTSPILYKSYLSSAKMKVLKPEVDALKAKHVDKKTGKLDQQAFSMEQMKLWRSAGVSPLGGCLPALLQIPIFMSLFYFFQSNIDLRGKSFLWASDLSTYDSILKLPFDIPFYGDHVSLFTLTAVVTSLVISVYSMSNMQDQSNPVMKYMPYIFPVLLLGVFNKMPAALTWYYTISNTITLILQVIIQKFILDHDKILMQLQENKKKPKKQSKFQERMAALQDQQQQMKKERTGKK